MLIELYSIFIPVVFIFSYIGILHKQIKDEIHVHLNMRKTISSYFLEGHCPAQANCNSGSIKLGSKIIYIRNFDGKLKEEVNSEGSKNQNSSTKVFESIEKKAQTYSQGEAPVDF